MDLYEIRGSRLDVIAEEAEYQELNRDMASPLKKSPGVKDRHDDVFGNGRIEVGS